MGKEIIPKRIGPWPYPKKDGKSRVADFDEVQISFTEDEAVREANRCMLCPVPACVRACPVNSDILGMMKNIQKKKFNEAFMLLRETNCIPSSTARVCPHLDNLCEASCILTNYGDPISIGMLQRFVSDWSLKNSEYKEPEIAKKTGKRIAIVGGGPTGLAAADLLVRYGHNVTIFDVHNKLGGTAMFGIQNYYLPKDILELEIGRLKKMDIKIRTSVEVGSQISLGDLFDEGFNAILISTGAKRIAPFEIEGKNFNGVFDAYQFLITLDQMDIYKNPKRSIPYKIGEKILIIGGGDTAVDTARTLIRLGAKEVTMMYRRSDKEMTAYLEGLEMAREEGVKIEYLQAPIRLIGDKEGWVKEAECVKMKLGEFDSSGRAQPLPIKGSNFMLKVNTVFIAIGRSPSTFIQEKENIKMDKWGGIIVNSNTYQTSYPGVFAAGDVVTGESLVIKAMREGRKAAQRIHEYLMNSPERLDLFQRYFNERYIHKKV